MFSLSDNLSPATLLQWYCEAGIDEALEDAPVNRLQAAPPPAASVQEEIPAIARRAPAPPPASFAAACNAPGEAIAQAREAADKCTTLEELRAAVEAFEGCAIRKLATNTVFADGTPSARVMIIGEAPGAQEDRQGIPFCGPSGMLLDKMFGAIGLKRSENLYISNTLFWRPPGNRNPTPEELAICRPFVEKHIALINPALLVLAGGVAIKSMLQRDLGISRLRGRFYEYNNAYLEAPVQVGVIFHPSYLLRSPGQKRLAWQDLLLMQEFLKGKGIA